MKRPPMPWGPRNRVARERSRRLALVLSAALIIGAGLVPPAGAQVGTASLAVELAVRSGAPIATLDVNLRRAAAAAGAEVLVE